MNKHCLDEFRAHWQCLDNNNHQLWQCRAKEWSLNKCVFHNLVRTSPLSGPMHNVQAQADRWGAINRNSKRPSPTQRAFPSTCARNRSLRTRPSSISRTSSIWIWRERSQKHPRRIRPRNSGDDRLCDVQIGVKLSSRRILLVVCAI